MGNPLSNWFLAGKKITEKDWHEALKSIEDDKEFSETELGKVFRETIKRYLAGKPPPTGEDTIRIDPGIQIEDEWLGAPDHDWREGSGVFAKLKPPPPTLFGGGQLSLETGEPS